MSVVTTAPTSGTAAIRRPVNELVSSVSARARKNHGITISITAKMRIGSHRRASGRRSPRRAAIGSSTSAAIIVRLKPSVTGSSSRTATRIKRYGIPQITHIAAKSSSPRRQLISVGVS